MRSRWAPSLAVALALGVSTLRAQETVPGPVAPEPSKAREAGDAAQRRRPLGYGQRVDKGGGGLARAKIQGQEAAAGAQLPARHGRLRVAGQARVVDGAGHR